MPQQLKQTPVVTFIKGLVTEATPLTFPEGASVDENNCELKKTGRRDRRKGIEFETGFSLSSFTFTKGTLVHSLTWENVSSKAGVEFEVIQVGDTLRFYDKSSTPISGNEKSFTVDLNTFFAGNSAVVAESRISGDSVDGNFVVVSPAIESFFIEYDEDADTISTTVINPKIRDFEWQGDTTTYSDKISAGLVSDGRRYDSYNAGWVDKNDAGDDVLFGSDEGYVTRTGSWPALNIPWFSSKLSDGRFSFGGFGKISGGNGLIGNGHFILDLYSKDRATASGIPSIVTETETARFSAMVGYAGRAWFSGLDSAKNGSRVYFTPVLEGTSKMGAFHQEADPTAEDISDLIDSDGGSINIPAASKITALFEWSTSLLVFAENGVWEIKGIDGIFKATEFSVARIQGASGILDSASLVEAEGVPFWWGREGIYTLSPNTDLTQATATQGTNVSLSTVQTFWEAIPGNQRIDAVGKYDAINNRVFWLYGNDSIVRFKYNKVLILDVSLQAFVPWTFEDESSNTNYVVGLAYFSGRGTQSVTEDVTDSTVTVTDSSVTVTDTTQESIEIGSKETKFLVRDGDTGSLSFATISQTGFLDWGTEDFLSYAEAGYDFDEDMTTYKHGVYVTTYFDLTETGFTGNETAGYDPIGQSSCLLKAHWDLKVAASSSQEVYRFLRPIVVDTGDLTVFNYPFASIITRNRIRGRGRNLKLRFESTTGKDFRLQGYEVLNAKNEGL